MAKNRVRKLLATAVYLCMVLSAMLPAKASALVMEEGIPDLTMNTYIVSFAGTEWWVVGTKDGGIYQQQDCATLLENNGAFGNTAFRLGADTQEQPGWNQYIYEGSFYDKRYYEGEFTVPNDYNDSTIQRNMEKAAEQYPSAKEQRLIKPRTHDGDGINNQKMWALSFDEYLYIRGTNAALYPKTWWLRSPGRGLPETGPIYGTTVSPAGMFGYLNVDAIGNVGMRPALSMDWSTNQYTADSLAKAAVKTSDGLISTATIAPGVGTLKFTIHDSYLRLSMNATDQQKTQSGSTLDFPYSRATTGEHQYLSCVLTDPAGVKYYARLADTSKKGDGSVTIPLSGVSDGTYTLKIFSEQVNDPNYTDFCSTPITMTLEVTQGIGTVSDFNAPHMHDWRQEWSDDDNYHWHDCVEPACPIVDNSGKDGYGEHTWGNKADAKKHWQECDGCGKKCDEADHTFGEWWIIKEATVTEQGSKERFCQICEYRDTEVIPKIVEPTKPTEESRDNASDAGAAGAKVDSPKTGDDSFLWIWAVLLAASGLSVLVLWIRRKKSQ